MKKVLIINGHPNKKSFNYSLAEAYEKGAQKSNAEVKKVDLADFDFDVLSLKDPKAFQPSLEIQNIQEDIKWADHLVFIHPTWWATMPAVVKVFFEQTFVMGFAGEYNEKGKPVPFLTGKSARIIATMDSPTWFYKYLKGNPMLKTHAANLGFCGIKPVKATYFGSVVKSDNLTRTKWIRKVEQIGERLL